MSASTQMLQQGTSTRYCAHGVELACEFDLPIDVGLQGARASAKTIGVRGMPRDAVERLWSGGSPDPVHRTVLSDDVELTIQKGVRGDHLIVYGDNLFHISADLDLLSCTPPSEWDAGWSRVLLDWITYSVSALVGIEALHASAVELDRGVLAFGAVSGSGKTTLAAEFAARGATFFCDDVLSVELQGNRVIAHPGPPFVNLDKSSEELIESLGSPLATFENEIWTSVDRHAVAPAPILAIVLLDRRENGPESPQIVPEDFMALRHLAIGLPHLRGREQQRFSLLTSIVGGAPLLRLSASSAIPPAALAQAIDDHLRREGIG